MADRYKVTSQTPTTVIDATGLAVPGMTVTFETLPNHVVGQVRIPVAMYGVDEVDRAIQASAEVLEAVQAL